MIHFDVNSKEVVKFTNQLEKMHKSDFPIAVRSALNDAAFDAKKNEIEKSFDENFVIRKKNFIKSHTGINKSKNTFDVRLMVSEIGVLKGRSASGDNLKQQEFGGVIKNKDFIPTDFARIGKSKTKLVSKALLVKNIKRAPGGNNLNISKKTSAGEFVKEAFRVGKGGFVRFDDIVFQVKGLRPGAEFPVRAVPVYSFRKNRSVSVKASPFISVAAKRSGKKIPEFFIKQAEKRISKSKLS